MPSYQVFIYSSNEYALGRTYELEYLREGFEGISNVACHSVGEKRFTPEIFPQKGIDATILLTDIGQLLENTGIRAHFNKPAPNQIRAVKVSDPWRFSVPLQQLHHENCFDYLLVPSLKYASQFQRDYPNKKVLCFPFSIGSRYIHMDLQRSYDLGLIGRCQIGKDNLHPRDFKSLKILHEASLTSLRKSWFKRKSLIEKNFRLILNLNSVKMTWSSPVNPKNSDFEFTPLRYIEAAACGAVNISSNHFAELNELYLPKHLYINAEKSLEKAQSLIREYKENPQMLDQMKKKALLHVAQNHRAELRCRYLLRAFEMQGQLDIRETYV